ncbi:hypothetical protein V8F20_008984 [Naviculisporaceae sp. PSN 640]
MLRRPPGHVAPRRSKYILALAVLVLPFLPLADAQQQHQRDNLRSPQEADHVAASNIAATPLTGQQVVETPRVAERRKIASRAVDNNPNYDAIINSDDASAAAHAVAPELSVRAPGSSLAKADSSYGVGGLSPHIARSLEDWELKDFVLLATVDGDLYASNRKDGKERWHLKADHPMVETIHFRANHSAVDEDYDPIDHYLWVVEPTRDGELYLWRPTEDGRMGLSKMDWTIKNMVETLSPHNDIESDIVYTGSKETTIVVLNAETGAVMKEFGASGSFVNKIESCFRPNALANGDSEECTDGGSITLARTEYTVAIHRYKSGSPVARLKYSEWGTNTFDNDLIRQAVITKDNRYVSGKHDGDVLGFEFESLKKNEHLFTRTLSSPVARVFDVLHRWDTSDGDLVVLPQPPIPATSEDSLPLRHEKVFINQTEEGGWYALSGTRYPLVVQAPTAKVYSSDRWGSFESPLIGPDLVGTHQLPSGRGQQLGGGKKHELYGNRPYDTIDPPKNLEPDYPLDGNNNNTPMLPVVAEEPNAFARAATRIGLVDLAENPTFHALMAAFLLWFFGGSLRRQVKQLFGGVRKELKVTETTPLDSTPETLEDSSPEDVPAANPVPEPAKSDDTLAPPTTSNVGESPPLVGPESATKPRSPSVSFVEPPAPPSDKASGDSAGEPAAVPETPKAKKKAHRGRRGGLKHKKGNGVKREQSQSIGDEPDEKAVEEVVHQTVKFAGPQPKLEPDITTVNYGNVDEVSGPILKMDSLEVNLEHQLGIGSNGTIVFAGKWDGRDVAVKRMLVQFNEIATHETNLLRMSDDHANVIRYYAQQQRAGFLYIALELCQASLADVIQKPQNFRELAQAGERNMPYVLYQIASGLAHLHDLRIVHRDLKPQNILVNMGKNGHPRLLVSDFGLCKKLEGGQSSFGATTAHAAGTTGWRAPELLLDDDNPGLGASDSMTLTDPGSSMPSGSGSFGPGAPNARRVTRAIDIFSLGLVFFYVLTKGNHPFDCGDRYMREVNIRKGAYNLDLLESLGDFAYEARELIGSMLNANPKLRPTVKDVMAHPFFWDAKKRLQFLVDVSDYFEKEPRDPPSEALKFLEAQATDVIKGGDFLKLLPKEFVDSLGKQRKYTGGRMLDLLRALRNKKNHYEDMSESLQKTVGPLPDGYLGFWTRRFPSLLIACWNVIYELGLEEHPRFRDCYLPARPELV